MPKPSTEEMERLPRVHLKYEFQDGGATKKIDLPFVIGVMSDLSGDRADPDYPSFDKREVLDADIDNFDGLMKGINPRAVVTVPDKLSDKPGQSRVVELTFASMDDFSPLRIAERLPELAALLNLSRQLQNLEDETASKGMNAEEMLKRILEEARSLTS